MGNWKFPQGWEGQALKKIPSVGEVWTLSGTTAHTMYRYSTHTKRVIWMSCLFINLKSLVREKMPPSNNHGLLHNFP